MHGARPHDRFGVFALAWHRCGAASGGIPRTSHGSICTARATLASPPRQPALTAGLCGPGSFARRRLPARAATPWLGCLAVLRAFAIALNSQPRELLPSGRTPAPCPWLARAPLSSRTHARRSLQTQTPVTRAAGPAWAQSKACAECSHMKESEQMRVPSPHPRPQTTQGIPRARDAAAS